MTLRMSLLIDVRRMEIPGLAQILGMPPRISSFRPIEKLLLKSLLGATRPSYSFIATISFGASVRRQRPSVS